MNKYTRLSDWLYEKINDEKLELEMLYANTFIKIQTLCKQEDKRIEVLTPIRKSKRLREYIRPLHSNDTGKPTDYITDVNGFNLLIQY